MSAVWVLALSLAFTAVSAYELKIPPHEEVARMARFVVNRCDWASMATISTHEPVKGQPFSNVFSISDGPLGNGTGTPYMYLTHLEISVQDLQSQIMTTPLVHACMKITGHHGFSPAFRNLVNPKASLSVSLAQTHFCKNKGYDPQSPLCAHIILSGSVQEVNGTEAEFAKKVLFSRHPEMIDWPVDHGWFFAKMSISQVWVLDYFGGVKMVSPEDYYKATPF